MSISGHATLKEIERYTRAANRSRLADSAMTTLQNSLEQREKVPKTSVQLANTLSKVSQSASQAIENKQLSFCDGGPRGMRTGTIAALSRYDRFEDKAGLFARLEDF